MFFLCCVVVFFFFKQKTAYVMRISDWSSDVCSSDLLCCSFPRERTNPMVRLCQPHQVRLSSWITNGSLISCQSLLMSQLLSLRSEERRVRERVCQYV